MGKLPAKILDSLHLRWITGFKIYKNINKIILWINRKAGENIISAAIGGLHSFALYTLNFTLLDIPGPAPV